MNRRTLLKTVAVSTFTPLAGCGNSQQCTEASVISTDWKYTVIPGDRDTVTIQLENNGDIYGQVGVRLFMYDGNTLLKSTSKVTSVGSGNTQEVIFTFYPPNGMDNVDAEVVSQECR